MVITTINLRKDQKERLKDQRKSFKLSRFVQDKLDEYWEMIDRLKFEEKEDYEDDKEAVK